MSAELYEQLRRMGPEERGVAWKALTPEQKAGVQAAREQVRGITKPAEPAPSRIPTGLKAFGTGAVQGLTFGTSEEIGGAIRGAIPGGEDYQTYVDRKRQEQAQLRESNPGAMFAGEMAGAVAPMVIPGVGPTLTVGRMTSGAGRVARTAGAGVLAGAADAMGRSEGNLLQRSPDALVGGALGGAFAGVGGGIMEGLVSYTSDKLGRSVSGAVRREVERLAAKGDMTVDEVLERIGNGEIMPEMSASLTAATRAYFQRGGPGADVIAKGMWDRAGRLTGDAQQLTEKALLRDMPDTPDNLMAQWRRTDEAIKSDLGGRYKNAYASAPEVPEKLAREFQEIVSRNPRILAEVDEVLQTGGSAPLTGADGLTRTPTLEEMEKARGTLSNSADNAFSNGQTTLGTELRALEERLRLGIDEFSPSLAKTRAAYQEQSAQGRAFTEGRSLLRKPPEEASEVFEGIGSEGQMQAARGGVASSLRSAWAPRGVDMTDLPNPKPRGTVFTETLLDVMGDTDMKMPAMKALSRASKAQRTSGAVTGGSATGANLTELREQGVGQAAIDSFVHPTAANLASAFGRFINRSLEANLTEAQRKLVTEVLVSEDPDFVRKALAREVDPRRVAERVDAILKGTVTRGAPAGLLGIMYGEDPDEY